MVPYSMKGFCMASGALTGTSASAVTLSLLQPANKRSVAKVKKPRIIFFMNNVLKISVGSVGGFLEFVFHEVEHGFCEIFVPHHGFERSITIKVHHVVPACACERDGEQAAQNAQNECGPHDSFDLVLFGVFAHPDERNHKTENGNAP